MTNKEMADQLQIVLNHISPVVLQPSRGRIAAVIEALCRRESEPEPQEEIKALRAALLYEWKYNHAEHCGNELPCPNIGGIGCHWPMPKILEGP